MNKKVILFTVISSFLFISLVGKWVETGDFLAALVFSAQVAGLFFIVPAVVIVFALVGMKLFGDKS